MKMTYKSKKIVKTVIVIIFLLVLAFGIFLVVHNKDALFNKVANGTTLYTQEQLDQEKDKAYNEGYNNALTDNVELKKQVEQFLKKIADDEKIIANKQAEVDQGNATIAQNETTITGLRADILAEQQAHQQDKETLQAKINELQAKVDTIPGKDEDITELTAQIISLQAQLASSNESHNTTITNLQNQIASLELQNTTIQNNNVTNLATITELNNNIAKLEAQVTTLNNQIAANASLIAEYEANKNAWLNSIAYYEQFISSLETETQAVAIFEVNGAVYNAQIVIKGTAPTVTNPADTETTSFAGWYVDNELVDINTYSMTTNTKFIAKFTSEFNVKFMLDSNTEFSSQKVNKNNCPTELETLPTKVGYVFEGFTINGVDIVNYKTYTINKDTTFIAKFSKLHTVTFISGNEIIATQSVKNGDYAQTLEDYTNEWLLNGELIDLTNYPIYADITLVYNTYLKGLQEYTFNLDSGVINNLLGSKTWTDKNSNLYYSSSNMQYVLNKNTNTWHTKTWTGLTKFSADYIWQTETNIYYSNQTEQFILDDNDTWVAVTWNGVRPSLGTYIWNYNGNTYYSNGSKRYVLDESSNTWNLVQNDNKAGTSIWVDSENLYSSSGTSQYIFDNENNTWTTKIWNGLTNFYAKNVWKDTNNNIYYSNGEQQYILNRATSIWVEKTWENVTAFNGENIVIINNNIYLLNGTSFYILY